MAETKSEPLCAKLDTNGKACGLPLNSWVHMTDTFNAYGAAHEFQPEAAASVPSDNQVARENKDGGTACAASGLPSPSSRVGLPSANSPALVASSDDRIPCPGQPATKCACTFDEIFPDQNNVRDGICIGCGFPRAEPSSHPGQPAETRFDEFDDAEHPFRKWWEEHGQYMLSGGGRRESIWAARGWIAREQLGFGKEVTGDSMHETRGAEPARQPDQESLRYALLEFKQEWEFAQRGHKEFVPSMGLMRRIDAALEHRGQPDQPFMSADELWKPWLKRKFPTYQEQAAAFMEEWGWRKVAWEFAEAYLRAALEHKGQPGKGSK